jgi:hypothetical protein
MRSLKRKTDAGFIQIIFVALAGAAAAAAVVLYTQTWDPLWNPFRPDPEEIIEKTIARTKELNSFILDSSFKIEAREENASLSGQVKTEYDRTDPESAGTDSKFDMVFSMEGMQFFLGGRARTIEESLYVKIDTFPAFPFLESYFEMLGINLSRIKGQWINFGFESYKSQLEGIIKSRRTPLVGENFEGTAEEKEKIQEDFAKALLETFGEGKLYSVKKEYSDEKVEGKANYHYLVALDREFLKQSLAQIAEDYFKSAGYKEPESYLKEFQLSWDKYFDEMGDIEFEVWIGKKDNLICKIKGEKEIESKAAVFNVSLSLEFSNFDRPLEILPPLESQKLEEIISFPFETNETLYHPLQKEQVSDFENF